jgi:lysophospholipase L1-like esterase
MVDYSGLSHHAAGGAVSCQHSSRGAVVYLHFLLIMQPPATNATRGTLSAKLIALDLICLLALLILPAAWLLDPLILRAGPCKLTISANFKPWLAIALPLAARIAIKSWSKQQGQPIRGLLDKFWARQAVLALISLYVTVGLLELALTRSSFQIEMAPVIFETTEEDGTKTSDKGYSDPELLWKFHPGKHYNDFLVNSLGYRDREIDPVKQPGDMRVICLGDSVTAQGHPPYSLLLHEMLTAAPPTANRWEAFNMAVYGYSSAQGLKVFNTQTRQLQPDIVTVFYGWNDHWLEMQTDHNRMAVKVAPWQGIMYNLFKHKRCFMLLFNIFANDNNGTPVRDAPGFRVPPEEYTNTLIELVQKIRDADAQPLLISAPRRNVEAQQHKFPEAAAKINFNAVHDDYTDLTRQVAAHTSADLLDLHAIFAAPEFDQYFSDDGIHFHQEGLHIIAAMVYQKICAMVKPQ